MAVVGPTPALGSLIERCCADNQPACDQLYNKLRKVGLAVLSREFGKLRECWDDVVNSASSRLHKAFCAGRPPNRADGAIVLYTRQTVRRLALNFIRDGICGTGRGPTIDDRQIDPSASVADLALSPEQRAMLNRACEFITRNLAYWRPDYLLWPVQGTLDEGDPAGFGAPILAGFSVRSGHQHPLSPAPQGYPRGSWEPMNRPKRPRPSPKRPRSARKRPRAADDAVLSEFMEYLHATRASNESAHVSTADLENLGDGAVSVDDERRIRAHLAECLACLSAYYELRSGLETLRQASEPVDHRGATGVIREIYDSLRRWERVLRAAQHRTVQEFYSKPSPSGRRLLSERALMFGDSGWERAHPEKLAAMSLDKLDALERLLKDRLQRVRSIKPFMVDSKRMLDRLARAKISDADRSKLIQQIHNHQIQSIRSLKKA
jgi:hypothetical protein